MFFLGIDTSNYSTSLCAFSRDKGIIYHDKRMLPVANGGLGLRQSDAVFEHTRILPQMIDKIATEVDLTDTAAVGVSTRPRNIEGSYMPCFLVGLSVASAISAAAKVPRYEFSHQEGHLMAALYATTLHADGVKDFIAFHVSGGTTDAVLCSLDNGIFTINPLATSLDAHAGQIIDRIGVKMQLKFPAGAQLSELAKQSTSNSKLKPTLKGYNCCLSGLQNRCETMLKEGKDNFDVARFCLNSIAASLVEMTKALRMQYGSLPVIYAGGVMQSEVIRDYISARINSAYFASPAWLSADNAAGVAILASERML